MSDRLNDLLESAKGVRKSTRGNLVSYKHGASVRKYGFEISDEEADALFRSPCHYCGFQPFQRFNGIDRVVNSLGYVSGNVVDCTSAMDLRGLTPKEYVRRKIHGEALPETSASPIPLIKPTKMREPKPIRPLRAHNFKAFPRRRLPALTASMKSHVHFNPTPERLSEKV